MLTMMLLMASEVYALSVDTFKFENTFYIVVNNSENNNVSINIYNQDGSLNTSYSSTASLIKVPFTGKGTFRAEILLNGTVYETKYFGLGSIINTGFKEMLMDAFEGDLSMVAVAVLAGVGLFSISIGRYAGLPVFLVAVGIFAQLGYLPAWMSYLIVLAAAFLFAVALYRWTGG